jgi:1-acyl-sn-glycerol-3-phosphate acyltransferase
MEFAANLWQILTTLPQGGITLIYHTPIALKDAEDRKTLAKEIEAAVRSGLNDQDIVATSIESRAAGSS